MRRKQYFNVRSDLRNPKAAIAAVEVGGKLGVLEETACHGGVKRTGRVAPVDKEAIGEDGLGVGREIARGDELKERVARYGVLQMRPADFGCAGKVVLAVTVGSALVQDLNLGHNKLR